MADPSPTLELVDQQLAQWEEQVARVKANLDLLEQTPSYVFIARGLKLTGRTQREIVEPILAARELTDQYEMLAGQVARARLLRDSLRRFLPSSKFCRPTRTPCAKSIALLNQPCVPLPGGRRSPWHSAIFSTIRPPRVSSVSGSSSMLMVPAFAAARDAVTRYDQVMAELTPALKISRSATCDAD